MEELQIRHRKEQKDLQSRVIQKKKQASKKTRKGVNEECERLEQELKEKHAQEIAGFNGEADEVEEPSAEELEKLTLQMDDGVSNPTTEPAPGKTTDDGEEDATAGGTGGKKRNRQKDRLARRAAEQEELARQAAEEAENLPDMKEQERARMLEAMRSHGLQEKEIRADGHCLYSAFADQLSQLDIPLHSSTPSETPTVTYKSIRAKAAEYIESHQDDFAPFLEEPLPEYVHKVRDTAEWGGQLELLALSKTFGMNINVLQDFGRVEKIVGTVSKDAKTVWLGYYKHGFGLGEHYNSLRKAEG